MAFFPRHLVMASLSLVGSKQFSMLDCFPRLVFKYMFLGSFIQKCQMQLRRKYINGLLLKLTARTCY